MTKKEALDILRSCFTDYGDTFRDFPDELKKNKSFVANAIQINPCNFQYIDESLKKDRDLVMLAASKTGLFNKIVILQYADESLKKDKEVVLSAIRQDALNILYADEALRKDKDVLEVCAKISDLGCILNKSRADKIGIAKEKDFMTAMVSHNGINLKYADESLKKDKDVVLAAVSDDGIALKYADESLKKDKDVVLAAVSNNVNASEYAVPALKTDPDVVKILIDKNATEEASLPIGKLKKNWSTTQPDEDGRINIKKYKGQDQSVTVPGKFGAYPVCALGTEGSYEADLNKNIMNEFSDQTVTDVTVCEGITAIGWHAFRGFEQLKTVSLPSSLKVIGGSAFTDCGNLTEIIIPDSVKILHEKAFYYCESLKKVRLPSHITKIADGTFNGCVSLESIEISNSVTSIGQYAFQDCKSLKSIELPSGITMISGSAFWGCDSLKYNEYEDGLYLGNKENPYLVLIKAKNKTVTEFRIHKDCRIIFGGAFKSCASLAEIELPAGLVNIGDNAFSDCASLAEIELPAGLADIGSKAFSNCVSLADIRFSEGLAYIGQEAFMNCTSLVRVKLPKYVCFGLDAFANCSSLEDVLLYAGAGFDEEEYVFTNCKKLKELRMYL